MSQSTFDGPVKAGNIRATTGTTLGTDVANVGTMLTMQKQAITQATTTVTTNIVIPANSYIHEIRLLVTSVWSGAATTLGVGTNASATAFTAAGGVAGGTLGSINATPGADATRVGNFNNTGSQDVRIVVTNTNTGTGTGILCVTYAQNVNGNNPVI